MLFHCINGYSNAPEYCVITQHSGACLVPTEEKFVYLAVRTEIHFNILLCSVSDYNTRVL